MNAYTKTLLKAPNHRLAQKLKPIAWVVTAAVLGLVVAMREIHLELPAGVSLDFLPAVHAVLNSLAGLGLIFAVIAIKKKNITGHRLWIGFSFACSTIFLLCYVAYHITSGHTVYGGEGALKAVYLILLISHIILAALSFPFILFTFIAGFTNQLHSHRKLARWVFPVWLYVCITGPICYLMLKPYYG
ncbi:DUF420 domain-containing protein [Persicirhabdus sediminis]|uniref:DUF420 domain-containing protein n=1 Tax=Persicirhabdus sediminis TaxID=454144 RepID=A0A8J7SII7_9BACT|nr:DUF420 domain-containing protein [Persicirhabdus sediminis]MBK1789595.1 DUF420 domain-containing protein [Persicirhabdus sediminis]